MYKENIFGKIKSIDEATECLRDGCVIMYGGFGGVGTSPLLIEGIIRKNVHNLTVIGNDTSFHDVGIGRVISNGQVKKVITSHIGVNKATLKLLNEGMIEVEFVPQGTLAERMRAKGAGIAGILTDVGIGTDVETGKEKIMIDGKEYIIETPLRADIGIVYAKKADCFGNLVFYDGTKTNNPLVAMAADITIVQTEEIVDWGILEPHEIDVSGVFVDMIVMGEGGRWQWHWAKEN